MCFNNGNNTSCLWLIIIIVLLVCCCGLGGSNSCGDRCDHRGDDCTCC